MIVRCPFKCRQDKRFRILPNYDRLAELKQLSKQRFKHNTPPASLVERSSYYYICCIIINVLFVRILGLSPKLHTYYQMNTLSHNHNLIKTRLLHCSIDALLQCFQHLEVF